MPRFLSGLWPTCLNEPRSPCIARACGAVRSAGCAPADAGSSVTTASAMAAAHTCRTRRLVMRLLPKSRQRPPEAPPLLPTRTARPAHRRLCRGNERSVVKENTMSHPKVLVRSEQSTGRVGIIESVMPPGAAGPPLHTHDFDEAFYVIEGVLTFQLNGELVEVGAGGLAFAPG